MMMTYDDVDDDDGDDDGNDEWNTVDHNDKEEEVVRFVVAEGPILWSMVAMLRCRQAS